MHMPSTRVTVSLSKEQHERLKVLAEAKAISLSELIRECCESKTDDDASMHQANPPSEVEAKYITVLEDKIDLLKEQLEKKDQLIESLINGQLVVTSGFRPLRWIRSLLSSG
jgi:hypothetical protein